MAEKIEIEILAKGKPAEKSIGRVDKKTQNLGKTTQRTGKQVDGALVKMRAGWVAVGAAIAGALSVARNFETTAIGLSEQERRLAKNISLSTATSAEQVAILLKSAKASKISGQQMEILARQAIALSHAFEQDAQTLNENLIMLNKTGEAQGFLVDILELSYSDLGIAINDLDLKLRPAGEKLAIINEIAAEQQRMMDSAHVMKFNRSIQLVKLSFIALGDAALQFAISLRLDKIVQLATVVFRNFDSAIQSITARIQKTPESMLRAAEATLELDLAVAKLLGNSEEMQVRIAESTDEVNKWREELGLAALSVDDVASVFDGLTVKVVKQTKKLDDYTSRVKDTAKSVEDAFVNMAMGSKNAFKDLMRSIVAEFIRANIRKNIIEPLSKIGIFEFLTPKMTPIPTQHTGGFIPSYHSGFRGDERLAKLQVGEAVINRHGASRNKQAIDAMNAGMSVGAGGSQVINVTYSPQVNALDPSTAASVIAQNAPTVVGVVRQAFNRNGQSVRL